MTDSYGGPEYWEVEGNDKDRYKKYVRDEIIKPNNTDGERGLTFDEMLAAGLLWFIMSEIAKACILLL